MLFLNPEGVSAMPRKHRRDSEHEPLSITPDDIPKPAARRARRRWLSDTEWEDQRDEQVRSSYEYKQAQRAAARRKLVTEAINWDACIVPGCPEKLPPTPAYRRDVDKELPICGFHAVVIKQQIEPHWSRRDIIVERVRVQKHKDQVMDGLERTFTIEMNGNSSKGQIYFLRLNGLVKVGWSSDLIKRLKAYGPEVQILCHYPGSRQDETLMHRQLRPYLAKGREWYQDCKLIADVVTKLVEQHGQPTLSAYWTEPKPDAIKPRRSA